MDMTETYRLDELDRETRDYLAHARERQGRGLPGLYVGQTDAMPVLGIVLGFAVIIATVLMTIPPTDPPAKEAMLQTAGLMLGGWMILAAFRAWAAARSGRYAGQFVYADADHLYRAHGSTLEVTDLGELRDVRAVPNFHDGKYQNTEVVLKLGRDRRTVKVFDELQGRRLAAFLNAVIYMRDGGEGGKDRSFRGLSPEAMGAAARLVATTGQFPADPAREEDGGGVRVPRPRRDGRPSTGLLGMLAVILIGTGLFLALLTANYPFRDEAVFAQIRDLPAKDQPPVLRLYLANDKFTAHRDEAKRMLDGHYETAVRNSIAGNDPELRRGLATVVLALKDKPTGALSVRTVEEGAPPGQQVAAAQRQKTVADRLADKWGITIGDELVAFAVLEDADVPANIELHWKFTADGDVEYVLSFRPSPDDDPVVSSRSIVAGREDVGRTIDALVEQVLAQTVGTPKVRPVLPPPEEF
jgi:hypothetical protein